MNQHYNIICQHYNTSSQHYNTISQHYNTMSQHYKEDKKKGSLPARVRTLSLGSWPCFGHTLDWNKSECSSVHSNCTEVDWALINLISDGSTFTGPNSFGMNVSPYDFRLTSLAESS